MNDHRLRALYGTVLDRRRRAMTLARVSVERLVALVDRRGNEGERLRTLDLVMREREGIAELEVLLAANSVRRRPSWRYPVTLAAAAVVLAVGVSSVVLESSRDSDRPRGGAAPAVRLIAPAERVDSSPITFSWGAVRGASEYEIEVLNADGLSAFVSTVHGTSLRLPETVHLRRGAEYRWWVVARRADGTRVGAVPRRLRLEIMPDPGDASSAA